MKRTNQRQYVKSLDMLRGIGITGIVLYHLSPSVFRGGFLGVPLFFVLSGYLMFTTCNSRYQNGAFHMGNYYKKRLYKLLPPLYIMVMAVCCFLTLFQRSLLAGIRGEIASIFLGYNNWWQIGQNASYFSKMGSTSLFTHLWFLAVELQLYLLWPILFLLFQKGSKFVGQKTMSGFFPILALLSASWMYYLYLPGSDPSRVYYGTDTIAFPLLIGISAGALKQQHSISPSFKKHVITVLTCIFLLLTCILFITVDGESRFVYQGGMFGISLFFAAMVCFFEEYGKIVEKLPGISFFFLAGEKSYPIYLWHYPLITLANITMASLPL